MTTLLAWAQVETFRLGGALRQYWRRIALGAACGWFASSVGGAFLLVWLESLGLLRSEGSIAVVGTAVVWSGVAIGGLVAYALRPQPQAAGPSA
jgi:hypothetical protein